MTGTSSSGGGSGRQGWSRADAATARTSSRWDFMRAAYPDHRAYHDSRTGYNHMSDGYDLVIYHDRHGRLMMDVRADGVTVLCGVPIPKRVSLIDGDHHRHDGHVAATFDVDSLRRRGMEDFARRINGIDLSVKPDLRHNPLTPDTLPPPPGDLP